MEMFDFMENDIIDDDLEILEIFEVGIPRQIYQRHDHFNDMDELCFFKRFRLQKETALYVLEKIDRHLEFPYDSNNAVSPMIQLLIALRFYATGKHLLSVADFGGVHVSTASRIIKRVSAALITILPEIIKFPRTAAEIITAKREFHSIAGFPKVIGAIDGTHIRIQSPGGEDAEVFRNRKSYFSMNVQAVSDARMRFINIVARWPGSAHDATIFNSSRLHAQLENDEFQDCVILGDSAYYLRPYLMTPLLNPVGNGQQLYNESQIRTRGVVEKLFGIWKRRFPVMAVGCRLQLRTTTDVILATAVLHNIARDMNEPEPPLEAEEIYIMHEDNVPDHPNIANLANNVRNEFIQYFQNL